MNKNEIASIFKYCSPHSLLVLTPKNKLVELRCPFKVRVKQDVGDLKAGDYVFVRMIKISTNRKTVFMINTNPYFYYHFEILLPSVK